MAEQTTGVLPGSSASPQRDAPTIPVPRPSRTGGTLYRGREGMWGWVLHRVTGVAIYFFLLVHILDTSLLRVSPAAYNAVIGTYKTPIMGLGEMALVAAICFHAVNGLRIILIDFWKNGAKHQRLMFWIVVAIWVILLAGFVPVQLTNIIAEF